MGFLFYQVAFSTRSQLAKTPPCAQLPSRSARLSAATQFTCSPPGMMQSPMAAPLLPPIRKTHSEDARRVLVLATPSLPEDGDLTAAATPLLLS